MWTTASTRASTSTRAAGAVSTTRLPIVEIATPATGHETGETGPSPAMRNARAAARIRVNDDWSTRGSGSPPFQHR